jgi:hypothetical protein
VNDINNPYIVGVCWYGVDKHSPAGGLGGIELCAKEGAPLYSVSKPRGLSATVKMYLCNEHVKAMQKKGFTLLCITK